MAHPATTHRVLRDLVPATLATGAAGLVVALVVGGASAGIRSVVAPGAGAPPAYAVSLAAEDVAAAGAGDGVTVQVRPARPRAIGVVSVLDLIAPPEVVAGRLAAADDDAVLGVFLSRPPAMPSPGVDVDVEGPVAPPPASAPEPAATAPAPTPSLALAADAKPRRATAPPAKSKSGTKPTGADAPLTSSSTSTERVAFGPPAPDAAEDDEHRPSPNGPPDHAPAYGRRAR